MQKFRLYQWCQEATEQISFGPDRKAVYAELLSHLEDRRDALMDKGMDEKEATGKALESMGNAWEIAPQLAAIHRPFWGYFLRVSQILLVILLVLGLIPVWNCFKALDLQDRPSLRKFEIYDSASYGGDTGRTLLHLSQPEVSFSSDGSTFTLTDAALITQTTTDGTVTKPQLYVLIRQTSPYPWTERDKHFSFSYISGWFSARDSLGNTYEGWMDKHEPQDHLMYSETVQSGLFTYTHECWINDFPADAEWVEICYERDGRNYRLYVDLTGGGGK